MSRTHNSAANRRESPRDEHNKTASRSSRSVSFGLRDPSQRNTSQVNAAPASSRHNHFYSRPLLCSNPNQLKQPTTSKIQARLDPRISQFAYTHTLSQSSEHTTNQDAKQTNFNGFNRTQSGRQRRG